MLEHDWRRGPTIGFDGTTAYVCVRCGDGGNSSYRPEVEVYDAERYYEHLIELNPVVRYGNSVNGLAVVEWEGQCLASS